MFELLAAASLGALSSAALCPLVMAAGLWDNPDAVRKAHREPTPSGGGLAVAAGAGLAIAMVCFWPGARLLEGVGADAFLRAALGLGAALAALALGLCDDVRPVGPRLKFGLIALISILFSAFVARAHVFPLAGDLTFETGLVFGVLGSALWMFTLTNGTNFIDGANGLSMGTMAVGLAGMGLLALVEDAPHAALLCFAGCGGAVGFLFWNYPNGKLFAGDAGSLFIGMLASVAGLILVQDAGVSPVVPPLFFFPVLADVLLTLAHRVKKGRSLFEPHREHLYQVGMRAGLAHWKVSLIYWTVTAHCAAAAFVAAFGPRLAPASVFAPQPGDVDRNQILLMQAAAWIASAAPLIALAVFAIVAIKVSNSVRRFAAARQIADR